MKNVIEFPSDLHEDSVYFCSNLAKLVAMKMLANQRKYGFTNEWLDIKNWNGGFDGIRAQLVEHLAKGDPLDVIIYAGFLQFFEERTAPVDNIVAQQQAEIKHLRSIIKDYEEVNESHMAQVRELDQIINGKGAAPQASLCDIVAQLRTYRTSLEDDVFGPDDPIITDNPVNLDKLK